MALKIEFVSDIKGFERVQRSLEENQKALNANADALARLNAEQGKMTQSSFDIKGIDAIKNASVNVQNLAKSFDTLMSNQRGMSGFLSTFSGFKKEVTELNKEQGLTILDTMTKQIDTLRGSVSGGIEQLKRLKRELADHEEAGSPKAVIDYKRKQVEEASQSIRENEQALKHTQFQHFMRNPLLHSLTGGQIGGSISPQFLMRSFGMLGAAATVGNFVANKATQMGDSIELGENRRYAYRMQTLDEAKSGAIGKNYFKEMGIGYTGMAEKAIAQGKADSLGKSVDNNHFFDATAKIGATLSAFGKMFKGDFAFTQNRNQALLDRANQLDESKFDTIRRTASVGKELVSSRGFMALESGRGFEYAENLRAAAAKRGLTFNEAAPVLAEAKRYGVEGWAANSNIIRSAEETGVSARARQEMFRRQSYGGNAYTNYGKIFTLAKNAGVDTSNTAYREAISDVIAQRTMSMAGQVDAGQVNAQTLQAMQNQQAAGVTLNVPERAQQASQIQDIMTSRAGTAGTFQSMGLGFTLMRLGVTNAAKRRHITALLTNDKQTEAIEILMGETGKSKEEITNALNLPKQQEDRMQKIVNFGSVEAADAYEARSKRSGVSARGFFLSNDVKGTMGQAGAGDVYDQGTFIGKDPSKHLSVMGMSKATTGRQIEAGKAQEETLAMQVTKELAGTAKEQGRAIADMFNKYLDDFRQEIGAQLSDVKQEKWQKDMEKTPMYQNMMQYQEQQKASQAWTPWTKWFDQPVDGSQKRGK